MIPIRGQCLSAYGPRFSPPGPPPPPPPKLYDTLIDMLRVVTRLLPVWITDGSRSTWVVFRSSKGSCNETPIEVRFRIIR